MNRSIFFSAACVATLLAATASASPEPTYSDDPFGDADFGLEQSQPLVKNPEFTTDGRLEVGVMFATSVIDKYTSHLGFLVDVTYHPFKTLGFNLGVGYNVGSLTSIITTEEGVIRNNIDDCGRDGVSADNCNIQPDLPDFAQVTGTLDALAVWTPLYGKVNVVSELDANLEVYGLLGAGLNGTRIVQVVSDPTQERGFSENAEGGFLSDSKVHGTVGLGLKVFLSDVVAIRTEFRSIFWTDEFEFGAEGTGADTYLSPRYFANIGASFLLF